MPTTIVLISGGVSAGKTTLCRSLVQRFNLLHVKTKDIIRTRFPEVPFERRALQLAGQALDDSTGGTWVRDGIEPIIEVAQDSILLVDAVRIEGQVEAVREKYGPIVRHIHLTAPFDVLRERYSDRLAPGFQEMVSYEEVVKDKTEQQIGRLETSADAVIDTRRCTAEDVLIRAASHLGLFGRDHDRLVDVLVGGQFGSEGKGHIAAYLSREYQVLIRVGGPNAGHSVVAGPEPYIHHLLPSGTRFSDAKLLLAPGAVLQVEKLLSEVRACGVTENRLSIDPACMLISSDDIASEARIVNKIGSTGQGVGAAAARKILGRGSKETLLARDVPELAKFIRPISEELTSAYSAGLRILVEGTQGTGLSLYHGTYPYVTSRDTSVSGALSEAGIPPSRVRRAVMVCRSYPIRVQNPGMGTSGPMSQEITWQTIAERSGNDDEVLRKLELTSTTRRQRRVGEFDWAGLRKAAMLNGPTDIALTFADYLSQKNTGARRFEQLTDDTIRFTEEVERVSGAPVSLISTRFHRRSIIDRRAW